MTFLEHLEALERLHLLIKRKGTGTPELLSNRFSVSVGTIKNLLKILKIKGLPVNYCREKQTYYYEYEVEIYFFYINLNHQDRAKTENVH
jgi:transcription initiation factor IIE alpha subunit